jgi:GNAT superfamily N-acetyltransferase
MYTHPHHTRKGVGRLILTLCEEAARLEGFSTMELMATRAGEPLYRACGYEACERLDDGGVLFAARMKSNEAIAWHRGRAPGNCIDTCRQERLVGPP